MAIAFDTLGYARRLREAGIDQPHAEAHADAARDFIMGELVTRAELKAALELQTQTLTIRLGGLIMAGVAALAVLQKLL